MGKLEVRLKNLEEYLAEDVQKMAEKPSYSGPELAARVLWMLYHPGDCEPEAIERVTHILAQAILRQKEATV